MRHAGGLLLAAIATAMLIPSPVGAEGIAPGAKIAPPGETRPTPQPLGGTLFFTRDQRLQMDRNRDRAPSPGGNVGASIYPARRSMDSSSEVMAYRRSGSMASAVTEDANVVARVQPGSVGMDIASVVADVPAEKSTPPDRLREKKTVKKPRAKPAPRAASPTPAR
jgi:hypothetical protein